LVKLEKRYGKGIVARCFSNYGLWRYPGESIESFKKRVKDKYCNPITEDFQK